MPQLRLTHGVVAILCLVVLWPVTGRAQLIEPVDGVVIDPFRPPAHVGAPGNRGWEYATPVGSTVVAAGPGVVAFAGRIGSSLYVSIQHADGLRTTYAHLVDVVVVEGDRVWAGTPLGSTGAVFHFGARRGGAYVDPAGLFHSRRGAVRVRLVRPSTTDAPGSATPPPVVAERSRGGVPLSGVAQYTSRSARHRVN